MEQNAANELIKLASTAIVQQVFKGYSATRAERELCGFFAEIDENRA